MLAPQFNNLQLKRVKISGWTYNSYHHLAPACLPNFISGHCSFLSFLIPSPKYTRLFLAFVPLHKFLTDNVFAPPPPYITLENPSAFKTQPSHHQLPDSS